MKRQKNGDRNETFLMSVFLFFLYISICLCDYIEWEELFMILTTKKDIRNRKGYLRIQKDFVDKYPEEVMKVMSYLVVVGFQYDILTKCYLYDALSYEFQELSEGEMIPEYNVYMDELIVEFVRK